jgi:putative Mn2+ efflux pump MntP
MRGLLTLTLIFTGSAAAAHPGHWADVAGHDHWVAGAAIGLAGLAAIWGALKGKKAQEEAKEQAQEEMEEEAA